MRGAKPGERRGGRVAGTPNKATVVRQEMLADVTAKAIEDLTAEQIDRLSPLDIMLMAMRASAKAGNLTAAAAAAKEAAPYVLPKLASTTVTNRDILDSLSIDDLRSLLDLAERAAGDFGGAGAGETYPEDQGKPH
jgi:hypothetical protein